MKRDYYPALDGLEGRRLLAAAHPAAAEVANTPVVLDGTLAINMKQAASQANDDGSTTVAVPVSGRLATLGAVKGIWSESYDAFGDYQGPDTLVLNAKTPKGALTLSFNNQNSGGPKLVGHSTGFYQHAQRMTGGGGAYGHSTENGSIEELVNSRTKNPESFVLISVNS